MRPVRGFGYVQAEQASWRVGERSVAGRTRLAGRTLDEQDMRAFVGSTLIEVTDGDDIINLVG